MTDKTRDLLDLCIDKLIQKCPRNLKFNCYNEVDTIPEADGTKIRSSVHREMIDLGYAEEFPKSHVILLSALGRKVKDLGGHLEYKSILEKEKNQENIQKELEFENLKASVSLNSWLYKTRWLPHILAIIAVAISVWSLIVSYQDKNTGQIQEKVSLED